MTQQRGRAAANFGPTWPEVPGLGRLPNKHFFTTRKGLKKQVSIHLPCLPFSETPETPRKTEVAFSHFLRFLCGYKRLNGGLDNLQFLLVQRIEHDFDMLFATALVVLRRKEKLVYGYIEHRDHLIKGIEAWMLAVILVIHDGARGTVKNRCQLLLRHAPCLTRLFNGKAQTVKI